MYNTQVCGAVSLNKKHNYYVTGKVEEDVDEGRNGGDDEDNGGIGWRREESYDNWKRSKEEVTEVAATSRERKIKGRIRKTGEGGGAQRGEEWCHANSFTSSSSEKDVSFLISASDLQVEKILLSVYLTLTLLKHYIN